MLDRAQTQSARVLDRRRAAPSDAALTATTGSDGQDTPASGPGAQDPPATRSGGQDATATALADVRASTPFEPPTPGEVRGEVGK